MHRFNDDWSYKIAENLVAFYYLNLGYDVEKADKNLGYDLLCYKPNKTLLVEVKLDKKAPSTKNIFWETEVDGSNGWTQLEIIPLNTDDEVAHVVVWVFPDCFKILSYGAVKTFDYSPYPKKEIVNKSLRTEGTYSGYGYLVPIKDLPFVTVHLFKDSFYGNYFASDDSNHWST